MQNGNPGSHLWGLYPGDEIHPRLTPELAAAATQTLLACGDKGPGFSTAWKMNLWARLHDGEHAYALLRGLLELVETEKPVPSRAGTCPNLMQAHPPFQIDANLGATAGVAEMLLQSHAGEIELLPALPKAWPSGSVSGLRAPDGFEIDIAWTGGGVTTALVRSTLGRNCPVRPSASLQVTRDGRPVQIRIA